MSRDKDREAGLTTHATWPERKRGKYHHLSPCVVPQSGRKDNAGTASFPLVSPFTVVERDSARRPEWLTAQSAAAVAILAMENELLNPWT